ncbi:hypothetical protein KDN24_23155 [Bacillus sp. Bva_UNVM-123]|uniref:hypothetical protein n=1 Tax=Bacillus sp. Bva_UNVM-123 TaxID=2829798 RepID=UPI00391F0515
MKKLRSIIPLLFVIIFILFISGYRFTAISAANNHSFLTKDDELVDKFDTGKSQIFLYKNEKEGIYRTVLTERTVFLYYSSFSTFIPMTTNPVRTIGGMSVTSKNDEFSLLVVESYDDEVAYIEAGKEDNQVRKSIKEGERIHFLFPFSMQIDFLNAVATNEEGETLYYFGYPEGATHNYLNEDLIWRKKQ